MDEYIASLRQLLKVFEKFGIRLHLFEKILSEIEYGKKQFEMILGTIIEQFGKIKAKVKVRIDLLRA